MPLPGITFDVEAVSGRLEREGRHVLRVEGQLVGRARQGIRYLLHALHAAFLITRIEFQARLNKML